MFFVAFFSDRLTEFSDTQNVSDFLIMYTGWLSKTPLQSSAYDIASTPCSVAKCNNIAWSRGVLINFSIKKYLFCSNGNIAKFGNAVEQ